MSKSQKRKGVLSLTTKKQATKSVWIRLPADHPVWEQPKRQRAEYMRHLIELGLLVTSQAGDIERITQEVLALRHSDIREVKQLLLEIRDRLNNGKPQQKQSAEPAQAEKPKSDLGLDPRLINALDDFLNI